MKKKKTDIQPDRESFYKRLGKAEVKSDNLSYHQFTILTILAYSFSLLCRLIWVYKYSNFEQLKWNGEFIPLTHDSFYFAKQALDAINHGTKPYEALSSITAFVAMALPFLKFETIIFYMPAVVGSTIVIPIMLIGRLFNFTKVGFISALISSITVSYYNRTMVGYYDTDMLNITLPLLILYFLMASIIRKQIVYIALVTITAFSFAYWYVASFYLVGLFALMTFFYLILFDRQNIHGYFSSLLIVIASVPVPFLYRLIAVMLIIALFLIAQKKGFRLVFLVYVLTIIGAIMTILLVPSMTIKISDYIMFIKTFFVKTEGTGLKYFDFTSLTGELEKPDLFELTARTSGNIVVFILSLIGFFLLFKRHRVFAILLPMFALGIMAFTLGGRYTIYAVPVSAIGFAYFTFLTASTIGKDKLKYIIVTVFTVVALSFNIKHITTYQNPFVISKKDIEAFTYLKGIANKDDYVYSWWDNGYAIQYYTGLKTLTDGGRNLKNGYIESLILTTDNQVLAYNLTKESAYIYDTTKNESLVEEMIKTLSPNKSVNPNEMIMIMSSKAYRIKSKSTFNVYLYLPSQMITIFDSIIKYSNRDLFTGQPIYEAIYYSFYEVDAKPDRLVLSDKAYIDTTKMEAILDKKSYLIKDFYIVDDIRRGNTNIIKKRYNEESNIIVIYQSRFKTLLIVDERTFNSVFIQFFIFGNYDSNYFDVVFSKPYVKIFALKR